jgi:hypothetical protein
LFSTHLNIICSDLPIYHEISTFKVIPSFYLFSDLVSWFPQVQASRGFSFSPNPGTIFKLPWNLSNCSAHVYIQYKISMEFRIGRLTFSHSDTFLYIRVFLRTLFCPSPLNLNKSHFAKQTCPFFGLLFSWPLCA